MLARLRELTARTSLAGRISTLIVLVMAFGLALAGVGTLSIIRDAMVAAADVQLETAMRDFTRDPVTRTRLPERCDLAQRMPNTYYLGVADTSGAVLCDNKLADPSNPSIENISLATVADRDTAFTTTSADGHTSYRMLVSPTTVPDSGELLISIVAIDLKDLEATTSTFTLVFLCFSALAITLGAALTRILAGSSLRDLRTVAAQAQRFADGGYDTRITGAHPRTEVGSLQLSLNRMLTRIEAAIEQRDESVKQMRQFVGDASHELRTPLVSVRGYAELYRMGAITKPEDVASAMERIESEARRMAQLVEDLLQLARLDERRPLDLQPLDLVPIVNDAASDARVQAPDRRITVVSVDADAMEPVEGTEDDTPTGVFTPPPLTPPAVVMGDENALRQVVSNLVGNALRYAPEGSPIELGVGVGARRRRAFIHVIDHGPGVSKDLRRRVFERFYRADPSRTRDTGGSGLGLAIVRGIARAHDGRIDVIETPGGGATFRLSIPLAGEEAVRALTEQLEHGSSRGRSNPQVEQDAERGEADLA